ncbi:MAG TPA: lasso RiPP family leader peptide-containing protein [Acidimicrobiales bacterium]|nr:lasso RiPP family leader peptide-containing protein [Acidimicrobiales bacterium]
MAVQSNSDKSAEQQAAPYEPPKLTRFGTIEEWTLGVLGGIAVSIVI